MKDEIEHIKTLVSTAAVMNHSDPSPLAALQYSQAALNAANAILTIATIERDFGKTD